MGKYLDFAWKCCIFALTFFETGCPKLTGDSRDTKNNEILTRTAHTYARILYCTRGTREKLYKISVLTVTCILNRELIYILLKSEKIIPKISGIKAGCQYEDDFCAFSISFLMASMPGKPMLL